MCLVAKSVAENYEYLRMQELCTLESVSLYFLSSPTFPAFFASSCSCPMVIGETASALSFGMGFLNKFSVASYSVSFPGADLQLSEGVGGRVMSVVFPIRSGVILNPEAMGASERGSVTGQQLPGDGILGDGGNGEIREFLNEVDEARV
jgi:hypothetical protein